MAATTLSQVYPLGSRLNEAGRLEVGGCDVIELAKEFGTPAYVYAEDDMRTRAREFLQAFGSRTEHFEVIYASKAFPCTAAYRLFAEEGLSCDVASAGELHLALTAGVLGAGLGVRVVHVPFLLVYTAMFASQIVTWKALWTNGYN